MHGGRVTEVVCIGVHEEITLSTFGTTVAQNPIQFGHGQMCFFSVGCMQPKSRFLSRLTSAPQKAIIGVIGIDSDALEDRFQSLFQRPLAGHRIE